LDSIPGAHLDTAAFSHAYQAEDVKQNAVFTVLAEGPKLHIFEGWEEVAAPAVCCEQWSARSRTARSSATSRLRSSVPDDRSVLDTSFRKSLRIGSFRCKRIHHGIDRLPRNSTELPEAQPERQRSYTLSRSWVKRTRQNAPTQ